MVHALYIVNKTNVTIHSYSFSPDFVNKPVYIVPCNINTVCFKWEVFLISVFHFRDVPHLTLVVFM